MRTDSQPVQVLDVDDSLALLLGSGSTAGIGPEGDDTLEVVFRSAVAEVPSLVDLVAIEEQTAIDETVTSVR